MNRIQISIKYAVDFFIAVVLFIPALLASVIIGILIKSDSLGQVIFKQKRLGRHNREFTLYKFRTMHQDAPQKRNGLNSQNEANGFLFKMAQDPRETKFGRFLRSTGLDELPQLINVLKGEMSLVGPRPLPISDVKKEQIENSQKLYQLWQRRQQVLPGVTGLWQISPRQQHSFEEMLRLDNQYIDKFSIWSDLKIIFATLRLAITALRPKIKAKNYQDSHLSEQKKEI